MRYLMQGLPDSIYSVKTSEAVSDSVIIYGKTIAFKADQNIPFLLDHSKILQSAKNSKSRVMEGYIIEQPDFYFAILHGDNYSFCYTVGDKVEDVLTVFASDRILKGGSSVGDLEIAQSVLLFLELSDKKMSSN